MVHYCRAGEIVILELCIKEHTYQVARFFFTERYESEIKKNECNLCS